MVRAMRATFGLLDGQPPGLALRCANRIPHGRGLGSSAAAIVSGMLAARALTDGGAGRLPLDAVLRLASRPGRPPGQRGRVPVRRADDRVDRRRRGGGDPAAPLHSVVPVVLVAPEPLATETARGVLPESVPHADAAANAARSALLVAALTSAPSALLEATRDWLHQPYRAGVMPVTADLVRRLRAGRCSRRGVRGRAVRARVPGPGRDRRMDPWGSPAGSASISWIQPAAKWVSTGT